MGTVLIAYASRLGSTQEIATVIADELRQTDHTVTVAPCATAPGAEAFDAVLIGSALYTGRWLGDATRYLRRQSPHLVDRPTFLFQSGPCGDQQDRPDHPSVPRAVRATVRRLGLAEPVTFAGRLDPTMITGRLSRWMASLAPAGDFRDWEAIRAWAYGIGLELQERDRRPAPQPPRVAAP